MMTMDPIILSETGESFATINRITGRIMEDMDAVVMAAVEGT